MNIQPVPEIGRNRPLCEHKVRVAAGMLTRNAQHRSYEAKRLGIPIDQCGIRSDFLVDGAPMCRAHAGASALAHVLENSSNERRGL